MSVRLESTQFVGKTFIGADRHYSDAVFLNDRMIGPFIYAEEKIY